MKVGVLASGSGTNLQTLLDDRAIDVVAVASDKPDARALERADAAGVERAVFVRGEYEDREARDAAMAAWLAERDVELVVTAGYMAILTSAFLDRFPQRVVNVHPSLLPAFPGLRAIEQAIAYGAKVTGVTVHFLDEGVDTGAVIAQQAIPIETHDPVELHNALRPLEHALLPEALKAISQGRVRIAAENPRRVVVSATATGSSRPD
ncbi:MAG: Phosphoribosylglycinamide formyltransferase [uncultured Solirubrobacteraceae bacterium]|uniref:Phosphoribosylglycinamide formyltransferase n=1 Tax=uncultured Solirubrobacteraceae bacterium TaxID=1162706 RepID=A0A6J4TUI2_9ACTN|nr:MAG: Phosphoribosylglycinamide formyltransferase [uncultured Solirubrobacteraceae bacterium]